MQNGTTLGPLFPEPDEQDRSGYWHRQVIGGLGFVLPFVLLILTRIRPIDGVQLWPPLSSVSAYYHTGGIAAFVGILFALAVYLFTYQGYDNKYRRRDRIAAFVAGTAALMVAFFPTGAPAGVSGPPWWTERMATTHYVSAVFLFGAFIVFCLFLFPKTKEGRPLKRDKRIRNISYYSCGAGMLICMLWIGIVKILYRDGAQIFWPEVLALEFFAFSWLVKGRADWTAISAAKHTMYYGRHPRQLVRKAWTAIRG
jgi:hypothetical protein